MNTQYPLPDSALFDWNEVQDEMIELIFVTGIERGSRFPAYLTQAGLTQRFAIIQVTSVEDDDDMYFDQVLWTAIIDFAKQFDSRGALFVGNDAKDIGKREIPVEEYLQHLKSNEEKARPAGALVLRVGSSIVLSVVTEYWTQVGGPYPYADNYAYSLFSGRDIGDSVSGYLRSLPTASRWKFPDRVMSSKETEAY